MDIHFVKEKESDFVLKLVISKWERKQGTSRMDIESCKRFVKKEIFRKEVYLWSGLSKIGMN